MRTSSHSAHPAGKAMYVALCSFLGVLLFVVLQRSLALIYYYALNSNFGAFSLGLSSYDLQVVDYLTLIAAVLLGLWYGVWLGLHWYDMVYVGKPSAAGFKTDRVADPLPKAAFKPVKVSSSTSMLSKKSLSEDSSPAPWEMEDLMREEVVAPARAKEVKVKKVARKVPLKRKALVRKTV
jgi:hypothetical protein